MSKPGCRIRSAARITATTKIRRRTGSMTRCCMRPMSRSSALWPTSSTSGCLAKRRIISIRSGGTGWCRCAPTFTAGRSARATTPTRIWRRFGSAPPNAGAVVPSRRPSMPKSRPRNNPPRRRIPLGNPRPVTPNPGNANKRPEQQAHEQEVMMQRLTRRTILAAAPITLALGGQLAAARPAGAAKKYGPGVTDSEIKIGNTGPYSGPLSNASPLPISMAAYFKMINDQGGVNGRKITFISYDDGYSPPKTVEMTRKLVESDEVFFLAGSVGTPTNTAIWHYMNQQKVPQLFPATGATKWNDPKGHPWTMGFFVSYRAEGRIYAAYILEGQA